MSINDLEARWAALLELERSLDERGPRLSACWSALPDSAAGSTDWLSLDRLQEDFERDYHALHLGKIELHLDRSVLAADELLARGAPGLGRRRLAALREIQTSLHALRKSYLDNRALVRHGKDGVLRLPALRRFNDALLRFSRCADSNQLGQRRELDVSQRIKQWLRIGKVVAPLIAPLGRCLLAVYLRLYSAPEETPQLDALRGFYRTLQQSAGIQIVWQHPERLRPFENADAANVLDLYVVAHASTLLDGIATAAIGHHGVAPCVNLIAAGNALPRLLTRTLDRSDHVILVGTGASDPIRKLLQVLKSKRIRRLILFPEGSVSSGLFELRHIREKFNPILLRTLHDAGYRLRLHPIVFPQSYRLYNDVSDTLLGDDAHSKSVVVSVGPTLEPAAAASLLAAGERIADDQLISRWIWMQWYRQLYEGAPRWRPPGLRAIDRLLRRSLGRFGLKLRPVDATPTSAPPAAAPPPPARPS